MCCSAHDCRARDDRAITPIGLIDYQSKTQHLAVSNTTTDNAQGKERVVGIRNQMGPGTCKA